MCCAVFHVKHRVGRFIQRRERLEGFWPSCRYDGLAELHRDEQLQQDRRTERVEGPEHVIEQEDRAFVETVTQEKGLGDAERERERAVLSL